MSMSPTSVQKVWKTGWPCKLSELTTALALKADLHINLSWVPAITSLPLHGLIQKAGLTFLLKSKIVYNYGSDIDNIWFETSLQLLRAISRFWILALR
jgi:hypothetical protein